jgi:hypothetical protein
MGIFERVRKVIATELAIDESKIVESALITDDLGKKLVLEIQMIQELALKHLQYMSMKRLHSDWPHMVGHVQMLALWGEINPSHTLSLIKKCDRR